LKKNRATLFIIFLTVFIDLLGFGIMIPLLPAFSIEKLYLSESMIGFIAGVYSLAQFVFSGFWGSLSDRYGRRPVLIASLAGSMLSYLMLSLVFSGLILSTALLIISRAFAGSFAANISAAQAAISDITKPEERSKGIALISAAFALGFVFGPAIGGILSENFGFGFPIYASALLSLIATVLCYFLFKETLSEEIRLANRKSNVKRKILDVKLISDTLKNKNFGKYILIYTAGVFSFSNIFGTFQLYAGRKEGLSYNQSEIGLIFSFMGICNALVQIFLIRYFTKQIGEQNSLILGCFLSVFGLGLIGFSPTTIILMIVIAVLAVGNGLSNTVSVSLLSQHVSKDKQGTVLGVNQSLGSLARFFGPVWGGMVYQWVGYKYPFVTGGLIMLAVTVYAYQKVRKV
jgi:DHA1 family tetracycline resistance protein-like MFS transporter